MPLKTVICQKFVEAKENIQNDEYNEKVMGFFRFHTLGQIKGRL